MIEIKILVISDLPPNVQSTGGASLASFLRLFHPASYLVSVVIKNPQIHVSMDTVHVDYLHTISKPNDTWGVNRGLKSWILQTFVQYRETRKITQKLQKILDLERPNLVLMAIQCQVLTESVSRLNLRNAKTMLMVWDHPSWWASAHNLRSYFAQKFIGTYKKLATDADFLIVPTENMAAELCGSRPKTKTLVQFPIFTSISRFSEPNHRHPHVVRVALAGQAYASREVETFFEIIRGQNETSFPKFEVHYWGTANFSAEYPRPWLVTHGFQPDQKKLTQEMSDADCAFLPYPGANAIMRLVSRTSFPSKLGAYIAAGLPVAYFGPPKTPAEEFILQTGAGVSVTASTLIDGLLNISRNYKPEKIGEVSHQFFSEQSALQQFRAKFPDFAAPSEGSWAPRAGVCLPTRGNAGTTVYHLIKVLDTPLPVLFLRAKEAIRSLSHLLLSTSPRRRKSFGHLLSLLGLKLKKKLKNVFCRQSWHEQKRVESLLGIFSLIATGLKILYNLIFSDWSRASK